MIWGYDIWCSIPQKNRKQYAGLLYRFGIANNKQSYQQVNRRQEVMTQKKDIEINANVQYCNICKARSMMEHGQNHNDHPSNQDCMCPYINAILHPTSMYQSTETHPAFEKYLNIKREDKPKDTLIKIAIKEQAFISYVHQHNQQPTQSNTQLLQNHPQRPVRIRQQFSQLTFHQICKTNTLLFARITRSRVNKCNISIANLKGQIFKYYLNTILSKKQGKIKKFIAQNLHIFLIVLDYTQTPNTLNQFPSIVKDSKLLYYKMVNFNNFNCFLFTQIKQKIQKIGKGDLIFQDNSLVLMTKKASSFQMREILEKACNKINIIQSQQKKFLVSIRGKKNTETELNFVFDMMMVSLWKIYGLSGKSLVNKIYQLFDQMKKTIDQNTVKSAPTFHTTERVSEAKNCCFCRSKNPKIKRPKRTCTICPKCSVQQEKNIYLCPDCFNIYHYVEDDVYIFRKGQKINLKKIREVTKMLRNKNVVQNPKPDNEDNQIQAEEQPSENQMALIKLDKICDEFFTKIDQLIDEGKLASTEYYLTMMMNMTIIKTNNYVTKFAKKLEANEMKIQHN